MTMASSVKDIFTVVEVAGKFLVSSLAVSPLPFRSVRVIRMAVIIRIAKIQKDSMRKCGHCG